MLTTAAKIVEGALDKISRRSAGQQVDGGDLAHCLGLLNDLCDELNLGPSFAYAHTTTVVTVGAGVSSLTIGPGLQVNVDRPTRIETSSFVRVGTQDTPLEVLDLAGYNALPLKAQGGSWPIGIYYDAAIPTARVFLWPQGACELHLVTRASVGSFADATTEYTLPAGYKSLLVHTLAERAAPDFEATVSAELARAAASLRRSVKRINLRVPQLSLGGDPYSVEAAFFGGD